MREGLTELTGGRTLAYGEIGSPDAPAVFYFHGFPGCRRELSFVEPPLQYAGLRVRIVALNRPGYGPSTFQPDYSFLDWPVDVSAAADLWGIDRFAVVGASGGSPYALACGYALRRRVASVGIVVGVAPLEATEMRTSPAITNIPATHARRRLVYGLVAAGAWSPLRHRLLDVVHREMAGADRKFFATTGARRVFVEIVREALSDGGRAAAYEADRYVRRWGFDLCEVTTPVHFWYGAEDRVVPASVGRWMSARLPNATLTVWPHDGHFSWAHGGSLLDVIRTVTSAESLA
jgi:pimeloyl-ACP methyl ester carboxylesterase